MSSLFQCISRIAASGFAFLRRVGASLSVRPAYHGPPVAQARPLNVLGREGWLRWELIDAAPGRRTYRLDFNGETTELEDFGDV